MDYLKGSRSGYTPLPMSNKEAESTVNSTPDKQRRPCTVMTFLRRTALVLLVGTLLLWSVSLASPMMRCHQPKDSSVEAQAAAPTAATVPDNVDNTDPNWFSSKLKAASPASLHELLHKFLPGKFQDGVFPSDREAVEAIHRTDPALATAILRLARREDNGTASTSSGSSDDDDTATSSETGGSTAGSTDTPPETSATSSTRESSSATASSTSVPTSDEPTEPTSTPPVETSASDAEPSTTSSSGGDDNDTTPPPTSSVDDLPGTSSASDSPSEPTFSPPPETTDTTLTTTTRNTPTTTAAQTTPKPSTSKSVITTYTSTEPNGAVVTVTTVAWVEVEPTDAPDNGGNEPTLQSGAAPARVVGGPGAAEGVLMAGVLGVVGLLVLV
ncbi:hypothetical protein VTJ04DRAFT_8051 [Mycothermus thermophilus]|uniref:uncharacterized protein n=1 Tax=Humicola insolens TaxID=85995 RepID=UPI0037431708